jgi:hypothetical protein
MNIPFNENIHNNQVLYDMIIKPLIQRIESLENGSGGGGGGYSEQQIKQFAFEATQSSINAREFVLTQGSNVNIDRTNPNAPVISSTTTGGIDENRFVELINQHLNPIVDDLYDHITNEPRHVHPTERTVWNNKQDMLVSGVNIKTVNFNSLLGQGNIQIEGGSGGMQRVSVSHAPEVMTNSIELIKVTAKIKEDDDG